MESGKPEQIKTIDFYNEIRNIEKSDNRKLILNPIYQRGDVWNYNEKYEFLHSLYNNIITQPIILNQKRILTICIDGKQRINCIYEFFNNRIPLKIDNNYYYYSKLPEKSDNENSDSESDNDSSDSDNSESYLNNDKFILNDIDREKMEKSNLLIIRYFRLNYNEQTEIFQQVQKGKLLTPKEKLYSRIKPNKEFKNLINKNKKLKSFLNKNGICVKDFNLEMLCFINYKISTHTSSIEAYLKKYERSLDVHISKLNKFYKKFSKEICNYIKDKNEIVDDEDKLKILFLIAFMWKNTLIEKNISLKKFLYTITNSLIDNNNKILKTKYSNVFKKVIEVFG